MDRMLLLSVASAAFRRGSEDAVTCGQAWDDEV